MRIGGKSTETSVYHHRDTEGTEKIVSLLCALRVSVVKKTFYKGLSGMAIARHI